MSLVSIAHHLGGRWFADGKLREVAREAKKEVEITWWRCLEIENRKTNRNISEVLWPARLPDDELTQEYVEMLKSDGYAPPGWKNGEDSFLQF